ncbi:phenylacetate--CoA ligase family protein [Microbaculum marinisediminis]|uniref:AMP-binding protein n=1 Tax=Microbaculum marinisediminis TaxID=2931392 RepID=A0AAW5QXL6_9HYPH|nr:AMP-binding protein [Microbaculum sp. A6E488]MCT8971624.1 AMP-binding protein [Microbaculum sp. A6E488]
MGEHFDSLETRDPQARERALFDALPGFIGECMRAAPGWADLLKGVDARAVTDRESLARLPVLRKSRLLELQRERPPFGGLVTKAPGAFARLFMSPGPIFEPEGAGKDWWRAARALFAVGLRPGDVVHNSFAYHMTPAGHMFESGARALGCAVIPAGVGNTELQVDAIAQLRPKGYAGTPDFLKVLLDKADELGRDVSSLKMGLVSGAALPPSLREELSGRGVEVLQGYGTADIGIIAYESAARDGMVITEEMIVEIVRPGTGEPVAEGEVGEIVVTSFNGDYPLIRFGTGDLSAVLPGISPCGRTNMRIKGWMGRADQRTKVKGMFVDPEQIAEIGRRHPEAGRLRLVVTRDGEQDAMTLKAEGGDRDGLAETLQSVTKMKGGVELVEPGSLPNDGKVIADERSYT